MMRISMIFRVSGNVDENKLRGRLRHRWKGNIKMDHKVIVCECVDWGGL
jgi:hypothetical protein